ncbi:MAG: hypothetical protein EHM70_15610 [Chloroflexota bacterium]|nr:MAG: hypothetical protein EHM70_15610 [Chloroflexota bacterium]
MTIQYDEKGKIFTNVISKEAVDVVIQTLTHRLHGKVYIRQGDRLIDELDKTSNFIAVTDATVFNAHGEVLYSSGFLAVNRDHIVWMIPVDEIQERQS